MGVFLALGCEKMSMLGLLALALGTGPITLTHGHYVAFFFRAVYAENENTNNVLDSTS